MSIEKIKIEIELYLKEFIENGLLTFSIADNITKIDDKRVILISKYCNIEFYETNYDSWLECDLYLKAGFYNSAIPLKVIPPIVFKSSYPEYKKIGKDYLHVEYYCIIIKKFLFSLIKSGDISWLNDYVIYEQQTSKMVERVFSLNQNDPIKAKFWAGDDTWRQDLKEKFPNEYNW